MTRRDTVAMVVMLSWWRDSDAAGGAAMVKRERGHLSEEGRQRIATARETMQFRPAPLAAPNLPFLLGCNVHATHASTRHSTPSRRVFQWRIDSVTEMTRSRVQRADLPCIFPCDFRHRYRCDQVKRQRRESHCKCKRICISVGRLMR